MEPITLGHFAQLTAKLEHCRSCEAFLAESGLSLDFWLSEQKRWLDEIAKRASMQQPRLFWQFLALLELERQRLGLPARAGELVHAGSPRRIAGGATNDGLDPLADPMALRTPDEDSGSHTSGGVPTYLQIGSPPVPLTPPLTAPQPPNPGRDGNLSEPKKDRAEIPTFLRFARPDSPVPIVAPAVPNRPSVARPPHATQDLAGNPPPPRLATEPCVAAVKPVALSGRIEEARTDQTSSPGSVIPSPLPVEPRPIGARPSAIAEPAVARPSAAVEPAVARPSAVGEPPRLQMSEYAEATILLEEGTMEEAQRALGRWNMDLGSWFDEVAYWNRTLAENRQQRETFERMLAARRR